MPMRLMKTKAVFEGAIAVEEADALQGWLLQKPGRKVDLARCTHIHPASLQVLLAVPDSVATLPADAALAGWLAPLFPHLA